MTPAGYTLKSLAGPALFVVAAYLFGKAAGRNEAKNR
jgi:hypothetical protein